MMPAQLVWLLVWSSLAVVQQDLERRGEKCMSLNPEEEQHYGSCENTDYWYLGRKLRYFWKALNCKDFRRTTRPVPTQAEWLLLRDTYTQIVGSASTLSKAREEGGLQFDCRVEQLGRKGRGIIAAEAVSQGQLLWSDGKTARFADGDLYREYLATVPANLACDIMSWAYIENMGDEENPNLWISVDLDETSFCNDAEEYEDANMGCIAPATHPEECLAKQWALSDIQAGDEVLCDYSEFAVLAWDAFSL